MPGPEEREEINPYGLRSHVVGYFTSGALLRELCRQQQAGDPRVSSGRRPHDGNSCLTGERPCRVGGPGACSRCPHRGTLTIAGSNYLVRLDHPAAQDQEGFALACLRAEEQSGAPLHAPPSPYGSPLMREMEVVSDA